MSRFHIHLSVDDLEQNNRFYSSLFGSLPSVSKDDYAKWDLAEPAWIRDPQGIAWEAFHTLDSIPTFSEQANAVLASGCCVPAIPGSSCC
jgi:catechol 2,3-dioxygenase-like lactoylglutathione lyase family enzyme